MNELVVIFCFVLVVLFAFVLPITIYSIRTNHHKKMAEFIAEDRQITAQGLEEEIISVKERVAVLECIVTEGRFELDKEFRRLESV